MIMISTSRLGSCCTVKGEASPVTQNCVVFLWMERFQERVTVGSKMVKMFTSTMDNSKTAKRMAKAFKNSN